MDRGELETKIKAQADAIGCDLIDLMQKRAGNLPGGVVLAIPLGVAAALFISYGQKRQNAIDLLNLAFDEIEGK